MSHVLMLCFLLFHLLIPSLAQTDGDITVGSSLTTEKDNTSWLSPSGDFAFGFHQLPANPNNDGEVFLLFVWYNRIPSRTIVWFTSGDRAAPENSKLELTSNLGLVLTDPRGERLWISENIVGIVSHATMNDMGNFLILGSNLEKLWESFEDPHDTLLPSQTVGRKKVPFTLVNQRETLPEEDPALDAGQWGPHTQHHIPAFQLCKRTLLQHWNCPRFQHVEPQERKHVRRLGSPFVQRENGNKVYLWQVKIPSASEFYHRITLNFDGVLTLRTRQEF
ncbi:hypothetical protein NL676_031836 [Syzygium grande]|nr:hypothetical protein NL676_031836 [Syzygium grande]